MQRSSRGRHRVTRPRRRRRIPALSASVTAGVAIAGAVALGATPTMSLSPELAASLYYLKGTNIGYVPPEEVFLNFVDVMVDGTDVTPPTSPYVKVPYNAGFRPFSYGGFGDLTYDDSVDQGAALLGSAPVAEGDIVFGYSQGAAAVSKYKAGHTGNTYLLAGNPNRPNGGLLQRFKGLRIPLIDVEFNGATPNNGDPTHDVVLQYDGWSDFPTYLWNPVAIANAIAGILFTHGDMQLELTAADLNEAKNSGDSDYYQFDEDSNTHYYVVRTYPVPLLVPLDWFLPDSIIAALDAPLRAFIETAYDRSDYSVPTTAKLFKPFSAVTQESALAVSSALDVPAPGDVDESDGSDAAADATEAESGGDEFGNAPRFEAVDDEPIGAADADGDTVAEEDMLTDEATVAGEESATDEAQMTDEANGISEASETSGDSETDEDPVADGANAGGGADSPADAGDSAA